MRELELYERVERSISKKFRKQIWSPFVTAVKRYQLIESGDKIAACISGGKDSMLMAKLLQMLQKYSDVPFEVEYLVMDPGYNELNRKKVEENAELLHIPATVCIFPLRFLNPIFLMWLIIPIILRVICVQGCGAEYFIPRQRKWGAIKFLWGII